MRAISLGERLSSGATWQTFPAYDIEAAAFWRRRGFISSKDDPLILFRSIADIATSLR
jgi:hypothetical protein